MQVACIVDDCPKGGRRRRGMCDMHYRRWHRYGDATALLRVRSSGTPLERWRSKIEVDRSGCWRWQGHKDIGGYGMFAPGDGGKNVRAHRWGWESINGPVPEGLELDHLCRVRDCVNPDHLEPVTHRENVLRGASPMAELAKRTHCPRGHEYDEANTYVNPRSRSRQCRACGREAARAKRTRLVA